MNEIVKPGEWPAWIRYTLSAAVGVLITVVTMTQAFSDVKYVAGAAMERATGTADDIADELRPRIKALELRAAAKDASDEEWRKNVLEALQRIEKKVDGR